MTPEEFLALHAAAVDLADALRPMNELLARVRQSFLDDIGVGETAADEITVAWAKAMMFPMLHAAGETTP